MLSFNTKNRSICRSEVQKHAREMREGRWMLNGQTVKFTGDSLLALGRLLDGQHRLMAIVMSGVAVPMLVAYGVPEESYGTIDFGRRRTAGDILCANGEKNWIVLGPAASMVRKALDGSLKNCCTSNANSLLV